MAQQPPNQTNQYYQQQARQAAASRGYVPPPLPKSNKNMFVLLGVVFGLIIVGLLASFLMGYGEGQIVAEVEPVVSEDNFSEEFLQDAFEVEYPMTLSVAEQVFTDELHNESITYMIEQGIDPEIAQLRYEIEEKVFINNLMDYEEYTKELADLNSEERMYVETYDSYSDIGSEDEALALVDLDFGTFDQKTSDATVEFPIEVIDNMEDAVNLIVESDNPAISENGHLVINSGETVNISLPLDLVDYSYSNASLYRIAYGPDGKVVNSLNIPEKSFEVDRTEGVPRIKGPVEFFDFLPGGYYVLEYVLTYGDGIFQSTQRLPVYYNKSLDLNNLVIASEITEYGSIFRPDDFRYEEDDINYLVITMEGTKHYIEGIYSRDIMISAQILDEQGQSYFDKTWDGRGEYEESDDVLYGIWTLNVSIIPGMYALRVDVHDVLTNNTANEVYEFEVIPSEE